MRAPRSETLSDLELLARLKGLSWLSAAQLKELGHSMSARSVKRKPSPDNHNSASAVQTGRVEA